LDYFRLRPWVELDSPWWVGGHKYLSTCCIKGCLVLANSRVETLRSEAVDAERNTLTPETFRPEAVDAERNTLILVNFCFSTVTIIRNRKDT
jgi:hypothetical protein